MKQNDKNKQNTRHSKTVYQFIYPLIIKSRIKQTRIFLTLYLKISRHANQLKNTEPSWNKKDTVETQTTDVYWHNVKL